MARENRSAGVTLENVRRQDCWSVIDAGGSGAPAAEEQQGEQKATLGFI